MENPKEIINEVAEDAAAVISNSVFADSNSPDFNRAEAHERTRRIVARAIRDGNESRMTRVRTKGNKVSIAARYGWVRMQYITSFCKKHNAEHSGYAGFDKENIIFTINGMRIVLSYDDVRIDIDQSLNPEMLSAFIKHKHYDKTDFREFCEGRKG